MNNSYCFLKNNKWYCLFPNRVYREIPSINWVENVNWQIVYYKLFNALVTNKISYSDLLDLSLLDLLAKVEIYL